MKTKSLLTLLPLFSIIALLCIAINSITTRVSAKESPSISCRYVSAWTIIEPDSSFKFMHGLPNLPLELNVWIAIAMKENEITAIPVVSIPYQEMNGAVSVSAVDHYSIEVKNNSENAFWIKVVAKP